MIEPDEHDERLRVARPLLPRAPVSEPFPDGPALSETPPVIPGALRAAERTHHLLAVGDWPAVSIVMAVRNESAHLRAAVLRVLEQDYPGPLEVVIAVGPSRDDTLRIARSLTATGRVTVVPNPSGATPVGLNAAIAASHHPVVVRVDGHSLLSPGYVRTAVLLLEQTGADNVGGLMAAEGETTLERSVATAMRSRLGVGSAPFHTGGDAGPADSVYLGVFRRTSLEHAGGYDTAYLRAQDAELNHRIRAAGGLVWFDPSLTVTYRPRGSLRALSSQYFHYGRWRRVVMRQHPDSVRLRYLAPPALLLGHLAAAVLLALGSLLGLLVPIAYGALVTVGAVFVGRGLQLRSRVLLPMVIVTMHLSWAWGFVSSPRRLGRTRSGPSVVPPVEDVLDAVQACARPDGAPLAAAEPHVAPPSLGAAPAAVVQERQQSAG